MRESLRWVVEQLMEAEVSDLVGASWGERAGAPHDRQARSDEGVGLKPRAAPDMTRPLFGAPPDPRLLDAFRSRRAAFAVVARPFGCCAPFA